MTNLRFTRDGTCYQLRGNVSAQPVLVLIHGVGLNQYLWRDWVAEFAPDYAVLTYDLLGHGDSPNPTGQRSLDDFCRQLARLMEELDIHRYHLVGFSLGALIALYTAAQSTTNLSSLVLLHSVFQRSPQQLEAIESRYELTKEKGPMATVEVAINRWFSPQWIEENKAEVDAIRQIFRGHIDDGYLKAYRVFCDADESIATHDLSTINCPNLMITGSLEPGSTPAMSQALAAELSGEVIINEGHLHMALLEHADILINQVKQFLERAE